MFFKTETPQPTSNLIANYPTKKPNNTKPIFKTKHSLHSRIFYD